MSRFLIRLNPIENLWSSIKEKLLKINIKSIQELNDQIIKIKEDIEGLIIENCIYCIKKRLKRNHKKN